MKYRFVYRPFVQQDLQNVIKYYKDISPRLAKEFVSRIREAKKFIEQNPMGDDVMYKDIRMHNIRQFPYHIHYYLNVDNKQIVILAIAFSKREDLDFSRR
nr:type II toxin-antitoxin system RelE/ParE family toxin [uncultured Flavobacterium sp.]